MLIRGMTEQEIRVLQEYRRIAADTLDLAAIKAIKHPAGGGEAPARSLVAKGYLIPAADGQSFTLTELAREFLSFDPKPEYEEPSGPSQAAEADA
jgi:hypothetical protein